MSAPKKRKDHGIANFARLALVMDRSAASDEPSAPIVARLENELAIANAALNLSRERAEDAEKDRDEAIAQRDTLTDERNEALADLEEAKAKHALDFAPELRKELASETRRADKLAKEYASMEEKIDATGLKLGALIDDWNLRGDKISALETHLETDAHRLTAAWRQIEGLKCELHDARSASPNDDTELDTAPPVSPYYTNRPDRLPKPPPVKRPRQLKLAAELAADANDRDLEGAALSQSPAAPRQPVPVTRQVWNIIAQKWQAA
jgi:hypothetical protein